jgi:hypothetical protein
MPDRKLDLGHDMASEMMIIPKGGNNSDEKNGGEL